MSYHVYLIMGDRWVRVVDILINPDMGLIHKVYPNGGRVHFIITFHQFNPGTDIALWKNHNIIHHNTLYSTITLNNNKLHFAITSYIITDHSTKQ